MKINSQRDFVSGVMFVAVGLAFAWGAMDYSFGTSARPGPGYFPFGLGVILAALGALVAFNATVNETEDGDKIGALAWRPLVLVLGAVLLFGFLLPRLGMALTAPVLIAVASLAGDQFKWKEVITLSLVLTVGSWAVFIKGLGLTIPLWPVFITG